MHWGSFNPVHVLSQAKDALSRFPLSVLGILIFAVLSIAGVHDETWRHTTRRRRTVISTVFIFPIVVSLEYRISRSSHKTLGRTLCAAAILLGVGYGLMRLPATLQVINSNYYGFHTAIHMAISWSTLLRGAPLLLQRSREETWVHSYSITTSAIMHLLFAGILFAGLAAAMSAVEYLFNATIPSTRYAYLRISIGCGYALPHWLSQRNQTSPTLSFGVQGYPHWLRILGKGIIGVLVIIYAIILGAYAIKIIVSNQRPEGTVGYMVIGFYALTILYTTILLPLTKNSGEKKLRTSYLLIGRALIGATILLFLALHQRVMLYGRTVMRGALLLSCLWMLLFSFTLLIKRSSIQSLFIIGSSITLGGIYAPYSIVSVSLADQYQRLTNTLLAQGFTLTQLRQIEALAIDNKDAREIANHVQYIAGFHGPHYLTALIPNNVYTTLLLPTYPQDYAIPKTPTSPGQNPGPTKENVTPIQEEKSELQPRTNEQEQEQEQETTPIYPSAYSFTQQLLEYRNIPFPVDPLYAYQQPDHRARYSNHPTYIPVTGYAHLLMIGAYRQDPSTHIYTFQPLQPSLPPSSKPIFEGDTYSAQNTGSTDGSTPSTPLTTISPRPSPTRLEVNLDTRTLSIRRNESTSTIALQERLLSGSQTQSLAKNNQIIQNPRIISGTTADGVEYDFLLTSFFAQYSSETQNYVLDHLQGILLIK